MQIQLGALAPKLSEQLGDLITAKDAQFLELDADAIDRLYIRGYIPESVAVKARRRLVTEISKVVKQTSKTYPS